jgi:hypothetical protein
MFSTIEDAWGSSFKETRPIFAPCPATKPPSIEQPLVEHFCPSCKAKIAEVQQPLALNKPNVYSNSLDKHFIHALLFGLLILIALHLMEK